MRCYLDGEARRRFDMAWGMLTPPFQSRLENRVRSVDEVVTFRQFTLPRYEGGIEQRAVPSGAEGYTWFDPTDPEGRAVIRFSPQLAQARESEAVFAVLHELAHAYSSDSYPDDEPDLRKRIETATDLQVAAWALGDSGNYSNRERVAQIALSRASETLDWISPE